MAFTSLGTTFDIANYTGSLYGISNEEAPLLNMIGSLNGGKPIGGKTWEWQTYALKSPGYGTRTVEGTAPSYAGKTREHVSNVTMQFKYGVELSYDAMSNSGLLASHAGGFTTDADQSVGIEGSNPVRDEMAWQLVQQIKEAAVDVNYEFWNSTYVNPTTNASGRSTRGLLEAITTNVLALDNTGPVDLTGSPTADSTLGVPVGTTYIEDLLKLMFDNSAPRSGLVLFCNSTQKVKITQAYTNQGLLAPRDRTVGGVAVDTLMLDFATVGVVLDRHLPQDEIVILNPSVVMPAFTTVPGKGHFFTEPKPSDGDSLKMMLYGSIGLEYGPEIWHGKITGLTT